MNKSNLLVLALACAGVSTVAWAQTAPAATATPGVTAAAPAPAARQGMKLDANGDGVITREEAAKYPRFAQNFDQIDANKDGKLSTDEFKAWRLQQRSNRDGGRGGHHSGDRGNRRAMTPEMQAQMQARMQAQRDACFDKADSDRNGQLSRAEFAKMHEVCGPMMRQARGPRAGAGAGAPVNPAPAR